MRLRYFAVLASVAALSACDESPVATTQSGPSDLSLVTFTNGTPSANRQPGVRAQGLHRPSAVLYPCVEYPDYPEPCTPPPKPEASFDYGSMFEFPTPPSGSKKISLLAWSDAYDNIENMSITGIFKSVGGDGPQGCNAVPQEFERETQSGPGVPWSWYLSIWVSREAVYPSTARFVWGVDGQHTFTAELGYSVDGYYRTGTFYSSARYCH